ncbi:unnamed protein product [Caenorhabditis angaria]|uniref:G-protein coupled receptors family 1 profile domain-containing protein n=1 Tax=Caenorhabditis angaria TaxID=860376 RepID=A0A9P1N4W5_9PELO|nr:unnamed protein product [Caenorhabditis angaria]
MPPDDQIEFAIRDILKAELDWDFENIVYDGPYLHRSTETNQNHVLNIIGLFLMSIILLLSIILTTVCAIMCYVKINRYTTTQSRKSKSLQFQLFYALVTQTLIPLILMHLPATILFIFTIFDFNLGNYSALVSMTIAIFPALDPFPVMLIIKSYRLAILQMLAIPVWIVVRKN